MNDLTLNAYIILPHDGLEDCEG